MSTCQGIMISEDGTHHGELWVETRVDAKFELRAAGAGAATTGTSTTWHARELVWNATVVGENRRVENDRG